MWYRGSGVPVNGIGIAEINELMEYAIKTQTCMFRRRVYTNHMITLVTVHDLFFYPALPQFMHCEAFTTMKMAARATAVRARGSTPEQPSRTQPAGGSQLWMMLQIYWFNFDESMLLSIFNVAYLFPTTCPNPVPWHDIINANILLWFLEWGHTAMDNRIHVGVLGCLVMVLDKSYNPVPLGWYDFNFKEQTFHLFVQLIQILGTDYRFEPSQWDTALLSNDASRWLGANPE